MGKWIVNQDYIRGRLTYLVEHTETGERVGEFDWQARAQEFADQLNSGEVHVAAIGRSASLRGVELGKSAYAGIQEGIKETGNAFIYK